MKKILIATSALAVMTASSAFALDVKTTGAVEYRYTKDKVGKDTQNPKLSQKDANIKFAAEGASSGLGYGAWVKFKSGSSEITAATKGRQVFTGAADSTANNTKKVATGRALFNDAFGFTTKATSSTANKPFGEPNTANGTVDKTIDTGHVTQDGRKVYLNLKAGTGTYAVDEKITVTSGAKSNRTSSGNGKAEITEMQIGGELNSGAIQTKGVNDTAAKNLANNAITQSAFWLSGSWGKFTVGQDGSAAGSLGISGKVKAAGYTSGTHAASAGADQKQGERWTYMAPTIVDGLSIGYTSSFKGNVSTKKEDKAKASTNWGIKYSTDLMGVALSVAHVSGTTSKTKDVKTRTNTMTGMTAGYGNFTVGYGAFSNAKDEALGQKKATGGSNMGVKYASGAWAVGYTVENSEDKNMYILHSKKTAKTTAYSASYTVAEGFNVYASKSNNSVKSTSGKTTKNNYTIIGAKISF